MNAVRIHVNGEPAVWPLDTTVADIVAVMCDSDRGVAVAVGPDVVPRSTWSSTMLREGDRVEIVTAVAGG